MIESSRVVLYAIPEQDNGQSVKGLCAGRVVWSVMGDDVAHGKGRFGLSAGAAHAIAAHPRQKLVRTLASTVCTVLCGAACYDQNLTYDSRPLYMRLDLPKA